MGSMARFEQLPSRQATTILWGRLNCHFVVSISEGLEIQFHSRLIPLSVCFTSIPSLVKNQLEYVFSLFSFDIYSIISDRFEAESCLYRFLFVRNNFHRSSLIISSAFLIFLSAFLLLGGCRSFPHTWIICFLFCFLFHMVSDIAHRW